MVSRSENTTQATAVTTCAILPFTGGRRSSQFAVNNSSFLPLHFNNLL